MTLVANEVFRTRTKNGELVEVRLLDDEGVTVRVGSFTVTPRWGSQECDDWLDWISSQRGGPTVSLPADEPGWLRAEGYELGSGDDRTG